MKITFDDAKRDNTLAERGLDFADAAAVFEGSVIEIEDVRREYGERRIIRFGLFRGRLVVVGYVQHGENRHVFSMRKANEREKEKYGHRFRQA